jgi:phage-related protein
VLDLVYKNLYNIAMTSKGSKTRIKWEADSNERIREFPEDARRNLGADLDRLDRGEEPLDSRSMGKSLPGVHELRDQDKDFWFRVLYTLYAGWVFVLHCFTKKTNETSLGDIEIARTRFAAVKARYARAKKERERKHG